MKFGLKEISELSDDELIAAHTICGQALTKRDEASKHEKFTTGIKKMEFPSPNPEFIKMKNEIEQELKKRELK